MKGSKEKRERERGRKMKAGEMREEIELCGKNLSDLKLNEEMLDKQKNQKKK